MPNHTYGYGRIDALAAVQAAALIEVGTSKDDKTNPVQIFPNPTSGQLHVDFSNYVGIGNMTIFDLNGKRVMDSQFHADNSIETFSIEHVTDGMFIYRIRIGNDYLQGKLIKL